MMTGLTPFILGMMRTPAASLRRANTDKLAEKYRIPPAWVRFNIEHWVQR